MDHPCVKSGTNLHCLGLSRFFAAASDREPRKPWGKPRGHRIRGTLWPRLFRSSFEKPIKVTPTSYCHKQSMVEQQSPDQGVKNSASPAAAARIPFCLQSPHHAMPRDRIFNLDDGRHHDADQHSPMPGRRCRRSRSPPPSQCRVTLLNDAANTATVSTHRVLGRRYQQWHHKAGQTERDSTGQCALQTTLPQPRNAERRTGMAKRHPSTSCQCSRPPTLFTEERRRSLSKRSLRRSVPLVRRQGVWGSAPGRWSCGEVRCRLQPG